MKSEKKLSHLNAQGEARMVDIGDKKVSARKAVAEGWIRMNEATLTMICDGAHKKGDVFAIARVAGIMAAKRTAEIVPLCHSIMLSRIEIELNPDNENNAVHCVATAETLERTGVEMEALTAAQTALLTIYDMCKAVDRAMVIDNVRLLHKSGGKSGEWNRSD